MEEEIMKFAVSFYLLLFFVVYILVLTTLRGSPLSSTTGKICHTSLTFGKFPYPFVAVKFKIKKRCHRFFKIEKMND
jgi:hypothetical protein